MSIEIRLAALEARVAALETAKARPAPAASGVASDEELDKPWGNPTVRTDPKRWDGPSYVGSTFSDCPPDYLRALAGLFEWQADKDEQQARVYTNKRGETVPTAPLKRKDAALARGWARRNEGKTPGELNGTECRAPANEYGRDDGSEIPF